MFLTAENLFLVLEFRIANIPNCLHSATEFPQPSNQAEHNNEAPPKMPLWSTEATRAGARVPAERASSRRPGHACFARASVSLWAAAAGITIFPAEPVLRPRPRQRARANHACIESHQ